MSEKVLAKIAGKELTEKDYQAFLQNREHMLNTHRQKQCMLSSS